VPELPEVETTRRDLEVRIRGRTIASVCFGEGVSPARGLGPVELADALRGRRFEGLDRRGKYLIAHLDSGVALVLHRRMTGNLVLRPPGVPADPYTRAVIHLDDGSELRWTDLRRFGTWELTANPESAVPSLGPEPLDPAWAVDNLATALAHRSAPVKSVLLDQRRVAGLGNIYVDESLHRAGIHPERPAGSLTPDEVGRLHEAIRQVLTRAIELQGSSARHHVGGYGQSGSMQDEWHVYHRTGEPCVRCGTPIERARIAGRGTHFCPHCQPAGGGNRRDTNAVA
jgi:formamidopyrimidine-DNA glycosylase